MMSDDDDVKGFEIGVNVACLDDDGEPRIGTIKWIGDIDEELCIGIEFQQPSGGNDGTHLGKRYFHCKPGHGEVVAATDVLKIEDYEQIFGPIKPEISPIEKTKKALMAAVNSGNKEEALMLRTKLQALKAQHKVLVNLQIESMEKSYGPIPYELSPRATIKHLKEEINKKYQFPLTNQVWIVGKKRADDDNAPISRFGSIDNESHVYLFLKFIDSDNWWVCESCAVFNIRGNCEKCGKDAETVDYGIEENGHAIEENEKKLDENGKNVWENGQKIKKKEHSMEENEKHMYETRHITKKNDYAILNGASAHINRTSAWFCSVCDAHNIPENEECDTCGASVLTAKPEPAPALIQAAKPESASALIQAAKPESALGSIRKQAGSGKESIPQAVTNEFAGWLCEQCIVVNSKEATKCIGCKVLKPGVGWKCETCTFENEPARPGCEMCTSSRPEDYQVPKQELLRWEDEKVSKPEDTEKKGWTCMACSLINVPARPGCEMCGSARPQGYAVSVEELLNWERQTKEKEAVFRKREEAALLQKYEEIVSLDDAPMSFPIEKFECKICFDEIKAENGIKLKNCLHEFCRECMSGHIENSESVVVRCPFVADDHKCDEPIQEREVRLLVPEQMFRKLESMGLNQAQGQMANTFHCLTPNCNGWCVYEMGATIFKCSVCNRENCVNCKTFHEGQTCKQYQDRIETDARTNDEARKTQQGLEDMLRDRTAQRCPNCNVIITKNGGCPHMVCSQCHTNFQWGL